MTVFSVPTNQVKLPIRFGHPPQGETTWAIVLDLEDSDPWVQPCPGCTVAEADGTWQAGCDDCRGRGWFDTATGLPVRMWWFYFATARVNWTLEELVPALLRAAGYNEDAEKVLALRKVTAAMLTAKRVTGTGLLEEIVARIQADWWSRLEVTSNGGRLTPPVSPRLVVGSDDFHPALQRASQARWDFTSSKLGWWAYRVAWAAIELLSVRQHRGDTDVVGAEEVLDDLERQWCENHIPLLLIEADQSLEPATPDTETAERMKETSR